MARDRYTYMVHLRPRAQTLFVSHGRTVLATGRDGFVAPGTDQGFFVYQTRLVDRYRYLIDGRPPMHSAISNVAQHTSLGYYLASPVNVVETGLDESDPAQQSLELRLSRFVGGGMHEDVDLTNFTQLTVPVVLQLDVGADMAWTDLADQVEVEGPEWRQDETGLWQMRFRYRASHRYDHQGDRGEAVIADGFDLRLSLSDSEPSFEDGRLTFRLTLPPQGSWHACLDLVPVIDDRFVPPIYDCYSFFGSRSAFEHRRATFLNEATAFHASWPALTATVLHSLHWAAEDLASLRLYDLDLDTWDRWHRRPTDPRQAERVSACIERDLLARHWRDADDGGRAWVPAAGLPAYLALYGRDSLTTAWQAGLLSTAMLKGTLPIITAVQGREVDDWRDEAPGKMIHEAQTNRAARLRWTPRGRYYGSITTSGFFAFAVSAYWHWTGDRHYVAPMAESALKALRWLDRYACGDDGFYYYQTRSDQGNRHQGWKDSGDAIVRSDGRQVAPPIATCEEQGFIYVAKLHLAELLWWHGDRSEAKRMLHEAQELKKRFNDAFWLPEDGFVAMALDEKGRPVRSLGSNMGHCLGTAIVDESIARQVADRLLAPDLFSGWGVRTLSSQHPAYNPYSYHRGSVWPVEQGTFTMAFMRYGLWGHLHRLAKAQFEAAGLFESLRLPELFSGHARDDLHPFPALYPRANWPQAWSSSSLFCHIQAMLGLYPYAPLNVLLVDPHLPEWLPELTLSGLRVGQSRVSLRFHRRPSGRTTYRVIDCEGPLRIIRQPTPWSLTAGPGERLFDLLSSWQAA